MAPKKAKSPLPGALKTLFPTRETKTPDDGVITMRPIPLKRLPAVMESFLLTASLASQGIPASQILVIAAEALLTLIDECIVDQDKKTENLTGTSAPFLADAFMDMNLGPEVLGKWGALVNRIKESFPGASGLIQSVSSQSLSST